MNPQIILPNGNNFELDMVLKIENDFFWIECKTGDYQKYIKKYSNLSSILKIPEENSIMVLTDITDAGAEALEKIFNMRVIQVEKFGNLISEIFEEYSVDLE